jgi:DNA integrity scanning protein DisA with diadenylate cyclase activity
MKNLLDIDHQIELDQKVLDFYYSSYQRTWSKISILVLIYSLIAIYVLQFLKHTFDALTESNWLLGYIYSIIILGFLVLLTISVRSSYSLLKPLEVAYLHYPKHYYTEIIAEYEKPKDFILKNYRKMIPEIDSVKN